MAIKSHLSEDKTNLTIGVTGRFDITAYKDFGQAYKDQLDGVSKIVIDMEQVDYVDSSALGMLLMLRERAGGDSAQIDIVKVSPGVKKIFMTANFDKLFGLE